MLELSAAAGERQVLAGDLYPLLVPLYDARPVCGTLWNWILSRLYGHRIDENGRKGSNTKS
jgi:hypothetical protein